MFDFLQPQTLAEAVKMLDEKENVRILAGGTDLIVGIRGNRIQCDYVLDCKKIPELNVLSKTDTGIEIGAAVTCNTLLESGLIDEGYTALLQGVKHLSNTILRNRATVVGNIVNASPLGDSLTATLVLEGSLVVASAKGQRTIPLKEFYKGPGKTTLEPKEIAIKLILPKKSGQSVYLKKQRVKGHDLAQIGVAGFYSPEGKLSMAFGAVGPTPIYVEDFGTFTKDELYAAKEELMEKAENSISPISDVRCSKEYRTAMVKYFVGQIVDEFAGKSEVSA